MLNITKNLGHYKYAQPTYPERVATGISLNIKEAIKEGNLEVRNSIVSKSIGAYLKLPFSS